MFQNILDKFNGPGTLQGKISHGIVINNNDPLQLQRVQARISDLQSGRSPSEIPWALKISCSLQGHTANLGTIGVPIIGAEVLLFFPEDDEHDIYYIGDFNSKNTQVAELLIDYPNSYGYIDASNNLWVVNTLRNTVTFIHISGSYFTVLATGGVNVVANNDMNFFSNTNVNIRAAGLINMDAPRVNINCGLATIPTPPTPRSALPTPPTIPNTY